MDTGSALPLIIGFKAFKATTLTVVGVTLLVMRHADPVDLVVRFALAVHLPLTSVLLDKALTFAVGLTIGKQIALGITALAYAALMGAEGLALYLREPWARWFTIGATSSLLPIELYEIFREPRPLRILILLVNVAVVVYLYRRKELFV